MTAIVIMFVAVLWRRDGSPPYLDVGVVCVAVTFIYLAYPLLAFLLAGLEWSEISDNRFLVYMATPVEFAQVAWWGTAYLVCLGATYIAVRKYPAVGGNVRLEIPDRTIVTAMVALFVLIFVYVQVIQIAFNVDLNPTYGTREDVRTAAQLPLVLMQVTQKFVGIGIVLQFALILLLVNKFDDPAWRWTLILWATVQVITIILVFGARSSMVFFALAWLLAHQRLRRPLTPAALVSVGVAILGGALLYGLARDIGGHAQAADSPFSANTEFQALYATAYDLLRMRETGTLGELPWQLYLADLLRLIPQQLLPFEKIDPGEWYLDLLGLRGSRLGFMFGVTAEAAVGLGLGEMALRGCIVGLCFGLIHNWYCRNATRFWPTLFYLWLCVWSYYTYRASTFYLLAHVLFAFIPTLVFAKLVSMRKGAVGTVLAR